MPLIVVTGPPCSGKSTHVADRIQPGDLVVDLDQIAHALGYPLDHIDWADRDHPAVTAARTARTAIVKALPAGSHTTWVIDAEPHPTSRQIWRRQGVQVIDLVPPASVCHDRASAAARPESTHDQIVAWYARNHRA